MNQIVKYAAVFAAGAVTLGGGIALGMSLDRPVVVSPSPSASVSQNLTPPPSVHSEASDASGDQEVGTLTAIGSLQRNTMVSVYGVVQRITDEDEFQIADDTGSVQVWTGDQFFTVEPGETVTVTGFVDDDLVIEIYAQEIVRQDGSVVTIGRPGRG